MALYGRLFSLVRPSQFYVQIFESRRGRITEISLYSSVRRERKVLTTDCHFYPKSEKNGLGRGLNPSWEGRDANVSVGGLNSTRLPRDSKPVVSFCPITNSAKKEKGLAAHVLAGGPQVGSRARQALGGRACSARTARRPNGHSIRESFLSFLKCHTSSTLRWQPAGKHGPSFPTGVEANLRLGHFRTERGPIRNLGT